MQRIRVGHYQWFSGYLSSRGVTAVVRILVAVTALAMAAAVLVLLLGGGGPQDRPERAMMWLAASGGAAGAALWTWKWPSHTQSMGFAAVTTVSIALVCVAYPDPLAALLGCVAFTTIGAYVAFFHSTPVVIGTVGIAVAVALDRAIEMATTGRIALAVVDVFLVLQANIAVVLAIHSLMRTLKGDLAHADLDPLTGLLNRRAFRRQILDLLARYRDESGGYLLVALLDLDRFKLLNDTYGHAVGDQALVAVADALRDSSPSTAVIARSGGEEFLVADIAASPENVSRFQNICDAIAGLPIPITASLGSAYVALGSLHQHAREATISNLIDVADTAMYRAKSGGGNQCHHHGPAAAQ